MQLKPSVFRYLAVCLLLAACARTEGLKVGDAVWAEWTPNLWYHGALDSICDRGFKVRFDDQDEKCNSPEQILRDFAPAQQEVRVGMTLLAKSADGPCYMGQVEALRGLRYLIRYYNGQEAELSVDDLRLPPVKTVSK